ncbi:MAG: sigma-54 interaction domain-containing protein [Suipraeoptans sp.]
MVNTMHEIINYIKTIAEAGIKRNITGRNALVKELFEYLFCRIELNHQLLLLCTKKGLILTCLSPKLSADLSGYSVSSEFMSSHQEGLVFNSSLEEFILVSAVSEQEMPLVNQLQTNLKMLLAIFDTNQGQERYLLDCLDSIESAICIYDKDACLLFGNKSYLDNMRIFDHEAALGMNILDITKQSGIKIRASKNGSNNLKMLDVLRNGNCILDWEVMIESEALPNKAQFVSNNMYAIKNKSGKVDGMIEVAHSHQVNLNKTKRIMGLSAEYTFDSIIGKSPKIKKAIEQAKNYADSNYNLLLLGESGVGKELFAQAIHNYTKRNQGPFVALNCASLSEHLIESELFGYVGGAFTGASKSGQIGKFELADGGTLFLDEVGELPFHFQSKLLRALETLKVTRIGSTSPVSVNVRVIAATSRDLQKMIKEGVFREDLYYRLLVLSIEIQPLRERREDLLLLADTFLKQIAGANSEQPKILDKDARKCMVEYDWPGNVRELRNVIQRNILLTKSKTITGAMMEATIYSSGYDIKSEGKLLPERRINERLAEVQNAYKGLIEEAIEIAGGNKSQAAELIGVSRKTLYRMIEKYY